MRILVLSPRQSSAEPVARGVARLLNHACTTYIEEFVSLNFDVERRFVMSSTARDLKKVYGEAELQPALNVVVSGGVLRYIMLKMYYAGEIDFPIRKLARDVYMAYDYVVYMIPRLVLQSDYSLRKRMQDQFTGVAITVLGNFDHTKLILDFDVGSKVRDRVKKITNTILQRDRGRV